MKKLLCLVLTVLMLLSVASVSLAEEPATFSVRPLDRDLGRGF